MHKNEGKSTLASVFLTIVTLRRYLFEWKQNKQTEFGQVTDHAKWISTGIAI